MSVAHPIIAVTGSSGAGTSTVQQTFEMIFQQLNIKPVMVQGDSFHRYDRTEMRAASIAALAEGKNLTHFGPEANCLDRLENLFQSYAKDGSGESRHYVHDELEAQQFGCPEGAFTKWQPLAADSDLLFYEGLHGAAVIDEIDIAQYPDLLIGIAPVINLEWMQKIHRDCLNRGYSQDAVVDIITQRVPDYIRYITPQFSRTHINFQRIPLVDIADPFAAKTLPAAGKTLCVISYTERWSKVIEDNLSQIKGVYRSDSNNIVVPGEQMPEAMAILIMPIIKEMLDKKLQMS
ncbi:MAG: phosphoribulokinase [Methylophaga sp.]|nr:phosphoribulokinase [Methylophaga sp.]